MLSSMWRLAITTFIIWPTEGAFFKAHNVTFNVISGTKGVKEESEIKKNMSTKTAIALLEKNIDAEDELVDYVKASLTAKTGLLQSGKQGGLRANPQGYAGLQAAKDKLNAMIHETAVKLDLELIRCSTYQRSQLAYIEKLKQDISTFNAAASAAAAEMLRAQAEISIYQEKLPEAKYDLLKLLKECREAKIELERQLRIVKADIKVMENVMAMTDCKSTMMLMLQCVDPNTGKHFWKYDENLIQQMQSLNHPESQRLVKDAFYPTDAESEDGLPMLALVQRGIKQVPPPTPLNATAPPSKKKQRAKCSIAGSPMCPKLRERFMDIATGIEDKRKELEAALRDLEKKCAEGKERLEAKIALYETLLKKEETALAQATAEKVNNEEQSRLTQIELDKALKEYDAMMITCNTNIENFRTEKCGLEKIRQELFKMKGDKIFFQDCETTDWTAGECTVTCGGGTQQLTRTISVYPIGGSVCPPLAATQSCNEDSCPVDCVLEDWTPWSGCSAACGGGVRSKSREVKVTPEHGGDPCGETSKTETCNLQACDVPCELSAWTTWGSCSKKCDGGTLKRVKDIVTPAIGQGFCSHAMSPERLQTKPCNSQPCINKTSVVMTCVARLDVVLLLDGSGSLGTAGWEATVKAGASLARSMKGDTQLGVVLFSGPTSYRSLWMCTGEIPGTPDMVNDCGIQWVSHFNNNTEDTAKKIEALSFPAKTTLTSLAISTAEMELSLGRADAASVVIVITDGKPLSETSTSRASKSIRNKARLMWVPVGRYVPKKDMRKWASWPWQENVVEVDSFGQLSSPTVLNTVIADMCPDIPTECGRPLPTV
jgi:hypothetical protein